MGPEIFFGSTFMGVAHLFYFTNFFRCLFKKRRNEHFENFLLWKINPIRLVKWTTHFNCWCKISKSWIVPTWHHRYWKCSHIVLKKFPHDNHGHHRYWKCSNMVSKKFPHDNQGHPIGISKCSFLCFFYRHRTKFVK